MSFTSAIDFTPNLAAWTAAAQADSEPPTISRSTEKRDGAVEQPLEESLRQSSARLEQWLADDHSPPDVQAERHEQLLRLAEGLASLPEDQRQAVELRHFQGCSLGDIARRMGRSRASIAGLLRRGLDALRLRELED